MAFKRTDAQSRAVPGFYERGYDSRNRLVALREQDLVSRLYLLDQVSEVGDSDFFGYCHGVIIQLFPSVVECRLVLVFDSASIENRQVSPRLAPER